MGVSERAAGGKEARARVPRSSLGGWDAPEDRADPVEILETAGGGRVQELLPIRYGRMAVSPFTFYRGAAAVMAADLATTPTSGLRVQMCGDAHLSNFGVFAAPDRRLVFDLNDFDETLPGPWEWDVKRLAASFEIAARDNGFKRKERPAVVETAARTYREAIREFAKCATSRSGTRGSTPSRCCRRFRPSARSGERGREGRGEGPRQGQPAGPGPAHPQGGRRAPDHQRPPLIVPIEDDRGRRRRRRRDGVRGPRANTRTP